MGSLKGNPATTTQQNTTQQQNSSVAQDQTALSTLGPNPEMAQLYSDFLARALGNSNQAWDPNTMQQVAPWTDAQNQAINQLFTLGGQGMNFVPQAAQNLLSGGTSYLDSINPLANQLTSPYTAALGSLNTGALGAMANQAANFGMDQGQALSDYAKGQGKGIQDYAEGLRASGPQFMTFDQALSTFNDPYIAEVVNATQNQFNNQNAIQGNALLGNAISKGNAFGGDRAGVAAGIMAGQQQVNQAPVIAGLYDKGFQTAAQEYNVNQQLAAQMSQLGLQGQIAGGQLGVQGTTAGGQMGLQGLGLGIQGLSAAGNQSLQGLQAAQQGTLAANQQAIGALGQNQQAALNSGNLLGNLGATQYGANLQGLGQAYGASQQYPAYIQNLMNAATQNNTAMNAYPFQTSSWLGSLLGGIGPLTGSLQTMNSESLLQSLINASGSQSGTTNPPTPSPLNSILGAALLGGKLFSGLGFLKDGGTVPQRAAGGSVPHMAKGGLASVPYAGAASYVPISGMNTGQLQAPSMTSKGLDVPSFRPVSFASVGQAKAPDPMSGLTNLLGDKQAVSGLSKGFSFLTKGGNSVDVSSEMARGGGVAGLARGGTPGGMSEDQYLDNQYSRDMEDINRRHERLQTKDPSQDTFRNRLGPFDSDPVGREIENQQIQQQHEQIYVPGSKTWPRGDVRTEYNAPRHYEDGGFNPTDDYAVSGNDPQMDQFTGGFGDPTYGTQEDRSSGDFMGPRTPLAALRAAYRNEIADPAIKAKLMGLTQAEVGNQGPQAQQAFIETVLNAAPAARQDAAARRRGEGQSLDRTMQTDYYPSLGNPRNVSPDRQAEYDRMLEEAMSGSNVANYGTGNASYDPIKKKWVGFNGGPQTAEYNGERIGIEGQTKDIMNRIAGGEITEAPPVNAGLENNSPSRGSPGPDGRLYPPRMETVARARAPDFMQKLAADPWVHMAIGLLSSRSPYPGEAIGQGLALGVRAANAQRKEDVEFDTNYRIDNSGDTQKTRFANGNVLDTGLPTRAYLDRQARTQQQKMAQRERLPGGMQRNPETGALENAPGLVDALREREASKLDQSGVLDPDAVKVTAEQYRTGDKSALTGLGHGKIGTQNRALVRAELARQLKEEGLTGKDQAAAIAGFMADSAAARTAANRGANIDIALNEAKAMMPLGIEMSEKLSRTRFVPVNQALQAVQKGTSDPDLLEFATANRGIITAYGQAMSRTGVNTVHAQQTAENLLSTATSHEAYVRQLRVLEREMRAAKTAPDDVRKMIENRIKGVKGEEEKQIVPDIGKSGTKSETPKFTPPEKSGDMRVNPRTGKPMYWKGGDWRDEGSWSNQPLSGGGEL